MKKNHLAFRFTLFASCFLLSASHLSAQNFETYEQTIPGTSVTFKMVAIPAGSFTIGSAPSDSRKEQDETPQKKVELSPFWMEEHEVTFAEWDAFFKNMDIPQTKAIAVDAVSRPTAQYIDLTWGMGRDAKQPANSMSQQAGIMYCKWLYEQTGIFYRLPTEAEWEYACRAGNSAVVSNDPNSLQEYGFFKNNSGSKYHKVMQLKPNAFGL
ncbi:MAG TPA: SUMF1/EgtB/PvdO family nonheme iron enzyme, partial [Ohtaekwangia sp.]|uniref:formylglycine-generating enzyme family protein n=1 Tax=Ohtaekwangia sp. TaxID=2066019 RepID=UPI002F937B66